MMMEGLKGLMQERDELDKQIAEERIVLETNNSTMDSALVDGEGFPIASIDVYSVRHARVNIIRLLNDRTELDKKIAKALEEAHEKAREEKEKLNSKEDTEEDSSEESSAQYVHRTSNTPFAKIKSVVMGGPAYEGGLRQGDMVIQWGSVHHGSFVDVKQMGTVAQNSEGKTLRVTVIRDSHPHRLEVRPRKWTGLGILGCALETAASI